MSTQNFNPPARSGQAVLHLLYAVQRSQGGVK